MAAMSYEIFYLFLSFHVFFVYGKISLCPNIEKCKCSESNKKLNKVDCQGINNMTELKNLTKDLEFMPIPVLKMHQCNARSISSNSFLNFSIKYFTSSCPFSDIHDDSFKQIDSLRELKLLSTEFTEIPSAVGRLADLRVLHINDGKLAHVEMEIQNMTRLRELSLKNNKIVQVAEKAFHGNSNLKIIDLSENNLISLSPETFEDSRNLKKVLLQLNKLNSTKGIFKNSNIQEINLRGNRLKSINDAFKFELELEVLDLGKNPLKQIGPKAFNSNVRQLKTLVLDQCELFSLPSMVFQYLTKLEKLDLSHNKLETISPEMFQALRNLREINLSDNEIRILGDLFSKNSRLERIDLSGNFIQSCDSIFYDLQNLKSIDLSSNQLEVIKKSDFLTTPSITNLILSKNNISQIESSSFSYLEQLKKLSLDFNRLMSLNNSLKNAPELETLLLQNNQFTEIGQNEFLNSPKLKRINLGYNSLTDIHGAFRNLISLESLTISQNRLTTLTRNTFSEQFKLKVLYASGNRWKCDCRFLWLLNFSHSLQHRFLCYSPPIFRKKVLSQLTSLDLTSWTDACEDLPCKCTCIPREEKFFVRVDCSNRNLTEVPHELPPEVGELYLQNNLLTNLNKLNIHSLTFLRYLDVEQNHLSNVEFHLPKNLETFKLSNNNLTRFLSYFPPSMYTWSLSSNPWICDCDAIQFLKFLKSESNKVVDVNATRCGKFGKNTELHGKLITELTEYELCPERRRSNIFLGVSPSNIGIRRFS